MLQDINGSLIIAGSVAGAAHLTGVRDSVVVVSSRQVRMHDCKNVDVYLLCASRPIIEDCSAVRFAPFPECYVCLPFSISYCPYFSPPQADTDLYVE